MRYAQIRSLDISNGENVGVALFVQGCHFHCKNCFNSETWDFNGGKDWTPEIKEKFLELIDRPYIKRISLLGGEPLADENLEGVLNLVTEINKRFNNIQDIVYRKQNNHNMLIENTDKTRLLSASKTIWIYSGYRFEDIFNDSVYLTKDCAGWKRREIVKQCTVMVDGRYVDAQRDINLKWAGSTNQRVINIKETFEKGEVIIYK